MPKVAFSFRFPVLLALALLLFSSVSAQECLEYENQTLWLGIAPIGEYSDIASAGDGLLVALQGTVLRVLDVTDPMAPVVWDELDLGVNYYNLTVCDGVAYLTTGAAGFQVVVIDPIEGLQAAAAPVGDVSWGRTAVSGSMLGVCMSNAFSVWDVTDPLNPTPVVTVDDGLDHNYIGFEGDRLVTADYSNHIHIFDMSTPSSPVMIGDWWAGTQNCGGIAVSQGVICSLGYASSDGGDWLYNNRWWYRQYGLRCFDLDQPTEAVLMAAHDLGPSYANPMRIEKSIALSGGLVLVATDGFDEVLVLDPVAPNAPVCVPSSSYNKHSLAFVDGRLFAAQENGLVAWKVPDGSRSGRLDTKAGGMVSEGILYRAANYAKSIAVGAGIVASSVQSISWTEFGEQSTWRIYVHQTGDLSAAKSVVSANWNTDLAVLGSDLLVADGHLSRIDVSDPSALGAAVDVPALEGARAVEVIGENLVAVLLSSGDVAIWDVTDFDAPALQGSCAVASGWFSGQELALDGHLLLVTTEQNTPVVDMVDVSNPTSPAVVGGIAIGTTEEKVDLDVVRPGRALVKVQGSVQFLDYDNPSAPELIALGGVPTATADAVAHDGNIYLLGNGIHRLDAEDLSLLGSVATATTVLAGVVVDGDFLAVNFDGLTVLPSECSSLGVIDDGIVPAPTTVLSVRPNPFNPRTTVAFSLERPRDVRLSVFDLMGRRVRVLAAGPMSAGDHDVMWDGRDDGGRSVPSGGYYLRLEADDESSTTKMMLLR